MTLTKVTSRLIEDTLRYVLGSIGSVAYTFTGKGLNGTVSDPTLTLSRGHTYVFENRNASGSHPFYIKTSAANGGTNDAYNTGVTNNGGAGGTEIIFTVPHDAPDILYYQCSSHSSMNGILKIAGAVADGSITEAKLADDAVTSPKIADNPAFSGTSGVKLPIGTTAQRVNTNALLRYNSELGLPEYYNGTEYVVIDSPPTINTVNNTNPSETQIAAGFDLVITGNGFKSGASVSFIGQNGTPLASPTVTVNSSTQITARLPNTVTAAQEPFDVKVTNSTGLAATKENAFNVNSTPSWTTASGTLATIYDNATGNHATVAATDPEGDAITYSGSVGGGLSLDASTGVISGNPTDVTSSTTLTFTITATDSAGNSVSRSFSIVVNPYLDGSSASRAATSAKAIKTLTGTTTSGLYWLKPSGFSDPAQFYCEMNYYGGGWTFVLQRQVVYQGGTTTSNHNNIFPYLGTQNRHSSNFSGVKDNQNNTYSVQDIWNGIVGASNNAAVYCEELQTTGGSYHERQAYTSSSDGPQFSYTDFLKFFNTGNGPNNIKVSFNNGTQSVTGKSGTTWGNLQTINNGNIDQELYYCNGNGSDANWSFGLMRGGTPYPKNANAANGGGRNSIIRWAIWAIRE